MKKFLFTALMAVLCLHVALAQDVITIKAGDAMKVKVLEVTQTEVKFKKSNNLEGPTYSLPKSEILIVEYANNTSEVFSSPETDAQHLVASTSFKGATTNLPLPNRNLFFQGQNDASHYYNGYKSAGTGTLLTSLVSPLVGLIPAIICSTSEPNLQHLNYPNPELMNNREYNRAYTDSSKKIKSRKVWTNWGIGFGVNLVAVILLTNR